MSEAPIEFPDKSGNVIWADISAKLVAATRPAKYHKNGLVTFECVMPYYTWCEAVTHKRLARNAMSHRAAGVKRFAALGWYKPQFHTAGAGMDASEVVSGAVQASAERIWETTCDVAISAAQELLDLGVCKSEALRMLPANHMIKGVLTGTEDAWIKVLELRDHSAADPSMQILAKQIVDAIATLNNNNSWQYGGYHIPYGNIHDVTDETFLRAAACIARVSYGSTDGRDSDLALAERLKTSKHLSPFEHIAKATAMRELPGTHDSIPRSALLTKNEDVDRGFGWVNYRSVLETQG